MRVECVSIIYQPPLVLLGMKKVRFGKGKYNGFGGGVEIGETLEQTVIRETREEAGITIVNPERMGKIKFHFQNKEPNHLVHFFRAEYFFGTVKESEEMRPEWFSVEEIPYDQMWEGDRYWLPLLLKGKYFTGKFNFNKMDSISKFSLKILDKF
jgi:8-oxo-dGTP diphosphatase/2-hydroxy-dATP diphosphatase